MPSANNKRVRHVFMSAERFNALDEKDRYTLYFLTNGELYKGDIRYSNHVKLISNNAIPSVINNGDIYINRDTKELLYGEDNNLTALLPSIIDTIELDREGGHNTNNPNTDDKLVTKKAVKDYIKALIANGDLISNNDGPIANVSASAVRLSTDLTVVDQDIGKYKRGDVIRAGTTIEQVLAGLLTKLIPANYIAPEVSISPNKIVTEAGERISISFDINYEMGDAGDVTQVLILKGHNDVYGDPILNSAYKVSTYNTPEPEVISDQDLLQFKVQVSYNEGEIKNNNLGEEDPENRISAGEITDVLTCVGQRYVWYTSFKNTGDVSYTTSDAVRSMDEKLLGLKKGDRFFINIQEGDTDVVIAYPKAFGEIGTIYSKILSLDIEDNFETEIVLVEGANHFRSIEYYVYRYTPDIPFSSSDIFEVTL